MLKQQENTDSYHVVKITKRYNNSFFVVENNITYYLITDEKFYQGDVISFQSSYEKIDEINTFSMFMISNKALYYSNDANDIQIISENNSYRNSILKKLEESNSNYADYALAFLFKEENDKNKKLLNELDKLGISYLFVISGLHIAIVYSLIFFIFSHLTRNNFLLQIIASTFSFYFLYLTFFPISGVRALIYRNVYETKKMNKKDSLIVTALIMMFLNPFNVFSISLVLSFSITFLIININSTKITKGKKKFLIPIFSFILSIPIITLWDNDLNLLSPLISIIFMPIVTFIYILLICFISFPFLWVFLNPIFYILNFIFFVISFIYLPIFIPNYPLILHIYFFILLLILFNYILKKFK